MAMPGGSIGVSIDPEEREPVAVATAVVMVVGLAPVAW